ncbi:MAG TPA: hypothetical protein VMC09_15240 [Anaerolineales bacterium]|nr:hypothetical protein [Anaerolineales bacterium]
MNATRLFLGEPASRDNIQVQLTSLQGLWGGWCISISGSREAVIQHVSPRLHEERYKLALSEAEFQALLEACIENDLLTVPTPERPGHPDETMIQLTLVNAEGKKQTVGKWAGDRVERFEAVSRQLFGLTTRTGGLAPFYTGPFRWPDPPGGPGGAPRG